MKFDGDRRDQRSQRGPVRDVTEAGRDLRAQAGARTALGRRDRRMALRHADGRERARGHEERRCVSQQRHRGADDLHEHAAEAGTGNLRGVSAGLHQAVALDESSRRHDARQERRIGDVERDVQCADQKSCDGELRDGQHMPSRRYRHRRQQERRADVGRDEDRPPPDPVDPGAGRQRHHEPRGAGRGRDHTDHERARVETDGDKRKDEKRHGRAELAHGLAAEQHGHIPVAQQASPRGAFDRLGHSGEPNLHRRRSLPHVSAAWWP